MFKEEQVGQCGWQAMSQKESGKRWNEEEGEEQDYVNPSQVIVRNLDFILKCNEKLVEGCDQWRNIIKLCFSKDGY